VKAGWTAGGGIEGAFGGGWSAKLEYLYVDLGKTEFTIATPGLGTIASENPPDHRQHRTRRPEP
jgi:outer membrane immunogenic protein